jgi:hypothetical protein
MKLEKKQKTYYNNNKQRYINYYNNNKQRILEYNREYKLQKKQQVNTDNNQKQQVNTDNV